MTNLEAAKAGIGANYPFDDETYELGLANVGLDKDGAFVAGKTFDYALASLILLLIASADIREGGYAVSLDREALLKVRSALLFKWGLPDNTQPYLKNKSYLW